MTQFKPFQSLLLFVLICIALNSTAHAITVDVYQNMENGNDGQLLTSSIMDTSCHGGVDGIDGTWDITDSMWVSSNHARVLPGIVTVNGKSYTGTSTNTWMFRDKYERNYVWIMFGTLPREEPYRPYHSRMTVACFLTPRQTERFWNQHDIITTGGLKGFSVLQLRGDDPDGPYIRGHSSDSGWVTTFSPNQIKVAAGKTYWINLHFDGTAGKSKIAVFDPDNNWTQVGSTLVAQSVPGSAIASRVRFGRCDGHGDNNSWTEETQSYISHISIDYTTGAFPLLPDNVQIKNSNSKTNTTHPQLTVYQNPSQGIVTIQIANISSALIAGSKLKIFDLSGRFVDELKSHDGKFFWNTNSVSTGTYLMRLEGIGKILNQRVFLIR